MDPIGLVWPGAWSRRRGGLCVTDPNHCVHAIFSAACTIASVHQNAPSIDPLTKRLFAVMLRLIKSGQPEVMQIAGEFDLTLSQMRMLFVLDRTPDLAVNELAEQVSLSMAAAGRAVDALHRNGLVSRREDDLDRRIKRLGLTSKGTDAVAQIHEARLAPLNEFVAALSGGERTELEQAIETLAELTSTHLSPDLLRACAAAELAIAGPSSGATPSPTSESAEDSSPSTTHLTEHAS